MTLNALVISVQIESDNAAQAFFLSLAILAWLHTFYTSLRALRNIFLIEPVFTINANILVCFNTKFTVGSARETVLTALVSVETVKTNDTQCGLIGDILTRCTVLAAFSALYSLGMILIPPETELTFDVVCTFLTAIDAFIASLVIEIVS